MLTDTVAIDRVVLISTVSHLYDEHLHWLTSWLVKKMGSTPDAADLAQDTFLRLIHKPSSEPIIEPRAYLVTIAHGLMVNHLRRKEIERAYLEALRQMAEPEFPSPESLSIALETLVRIDMMLQGLPPKVRSAFLLSQLEGLSHAEIAQRLCVSVSSVRKYIAKALLHCIAIGRHG